MASLKKPEDCPHCGRNLIFFVVADWTVPNYEGWICAHCHGTSARDLKYPESFIIHRKKYNKNMCRQCGCQRSDENPFAHKKNLCKKCQSSNHTKYRGEKKDVLKQKRDVYWSKMDYGVRGERVRQAVQRSPESFLRNLLHHIRKTSRKKLCEQGKLSPECLKIEIDFDFMWSMFQSQNGLCAITKLPMTHIFRSMYAMSIDRIDSSKGYLKGNVQLVCQAINRMKNCHMNNDVHSFFNDYFQNRLKRLNDGIAKLSDQTGVWDEDFVRVDGVIVDQLKDIVEGKT
jgi:hypothetical protein